MQPFTIDGLDLTDAARTALARADIVAPTDIQRAAARPLLHGHDTVLQAGTGTGKTLAYLLPLMQRLRADPKLRVLVLAPTPELAVQILRVVEAIKPAGVGSVALVGGGNPDRQKDKLKKHPAFMVGTPGRVLDLIAQKKVKLPTLSIAVLDETDEILAAQAHRAAVLEVFANPALTCQRICVSATAGPDLQTFVAQCMRPEAVRIALDSTPLSATIRHWRIGYDLTRKEVALMTLLRDQHIGQALIFVNKQHNVPHLYAFLNAQGVPTAGLSAGRDKTSRQSALQSFTKGAVRLLVATDAAARGIDVPRLPWVVHYEPARDVQTYVHRAGRTGRAGQHGQSVTLVAPNESHLLRRYSKELGIDFTSFGAGGRNRTDTPCGTGF